MKKLILCLGLLLLAAVSSARVQHVCDEIIFQVGLVDPTENYEPYEKGPIVIPAVSLEDHILYFATPCDGCTLRLVEK